MNYRHSYHAGNFADVFKHFLLSIMLEKLTEKERPISFVDTHAGAGRYDLRSADAAKSREAASGILRILKRKDIPAGFRRYFELVLRDNEPTPDGDISNYPGSPLLAARLLRSTDRLLLVEQQPETHLALRRLFRDDARVSIHRRDAYESLGGLLPPAPAGGLILIDPPYEDPDEFGKLDRALPLALARWPQGTFCVWYPVKDRLSADRFEKSLSKKAVDVLAIRLAINTINSNGGLRACGMLILRAPWGVEEKLSAALPWLCEALSDSPERQLSLRRLS